MNDTLCIKLTALFVISGGRYFAKWDEIAFQNVTRGRMYSMFIARCKTIVLYCIVLYNTKTGLYRFFLLNDNSLCYFSYHLIYIPLLLSVGYNF